jgi:hypothetical protein
VNHLRLPIALVSIGALSIVIASTGCSAPPGAGNADDNSGETSDEALSSTIGTVSKDPFSEDACNVGSFTELRDSTSFLQKKMIRYELVVEKRDCTTANGCGDWTKQSTLFGEPLIGRASPSPASGPLGVFLRFDGRSSQGEKLRLECRVERAVENDYDLKPWASIACGGPYVVASTDNGAYFTADPQKDGPYFFLQGTLTGNCLSVNATWTTNTLGRASVWTEWKAALRTDF